MTQTNVRVNPGSVKAYGAAAQDRFASIRKELTTLVTEVSTVHYFGPNAVLVKRECGQLAQQFSQEMLKDLAGIAESVRAATSNIASTLGGQPINIEVNGSPVPAPDIAQGDGSVDVDLQALEQLVPVVQGSFDAITRALEDHFTILRGADWDGTAKNNAVDAVKRFTSQATTMSLNSRESIVDVIRKQIESTTAADH